ncbi:MAG TPA: hypothetical protein VFX85_09490 [Solirubrobacterales bacterium]|nr:hypothetical protein [Solirubrobacterales bacterium]
MELWRGGSCWRSGLGDARSSTGSSAGDCIRSSEGYTRSAGRQLRGRPTLAAEDIPIHDDIPVTCPARTLVDVASELGPIAVERMVNDADKRDLIDPETLRAALDGYAGEPGVRPLRNLLDKLTFRLSDSDLEIYFRPIAAAAKLPPPLTKGFVNPLGAGPRRAP